MTGEESAVKREARRVCRLQTRGVGDEQYVHISKRETDHVHSWRTFLSNFDRVDEFIGCEIASKLCIITSSAADIRILLVSFRCRENVTLVERDRCVNGEKCFCVRGSMRNTVKLDVESVATLKIINVIHLSFFHTL